MTGGGGLAGSGAATNGGGAWTLAAEALADGALATLAEGSGCDDVSPATGAAIDAAGPVAALDAEAVASAVGEEVEAPPLGRWSTR